jgi:integrase
LSEEELPRLKRALDEKQYRKGTRAINRTFYRLRLIVLIALTTGIRMAEIFGLRWEDAMYHEGLLAVRLKLKGGNAIPPNASRTRQQAATVSTVISEDRIFRRSQARRVDGSAWKEEGSDQRLPFP